MVDIGLVDTGIRHDKAQAMLGDHHVTLAAEDLVRFGQDHLDEPRVLVTLLCNIPRAWARDYLVEPAIAALGLRDDLLGDHQDVPIAGCVSRRLDARDQKRRKIVTGPDERDPWDCDQAYSGCGHACAPEANASGPFPSRVPHAGRAYRYGAD